MSIGASTESSVPRRIWFGWRGQFKPESLRQAELITSLLLTCFCVGLHFLRLFRSGPLWRDEAAVVGLANLPSLKEVFVQFPHEAFPMLFPLTVRAVTHVGGNADFAFRIFGLVIGIGIVGALWSTMWLIHRRPPLLSLALLGLNGAMIQWGDSLRGYGMGTMFIVFSVGLIWRLVEEPRRWGFWAALVAAVAAVQCLFHNPPLLLAIGLAGIAVALRRRAWRPALLILLAGLAAAVSLLPYWKPLREARQWDEVVRLSTHASDLLRGIGEVLAASGWSNIWIWLGLFILAQALCWSGQTAGTDTSVGGGSGRALTPPGARADSRDLLLYCGVSLLLGLGGCFGFLKVLSYFPRAWYFLALIAMSGVLLDAAFETLRQRWARVGRLALVGAVILISIPSSWKAARTRQSNMDLVAAKLGNVPAHDLIVLRPWHMGISFARYYTGAAPWMTVPPVDFHKFHRYDLIQAQLLNADQALQPICERIRATLKSGHTIWFIGELVSSPVPGQVQSKGTVVSSNWSHQLAAFLRASAMHMQSVPIACGPPVDELEDLPLWKIDGWAGGGG